MLPGGIAANNLRNGNGVALAALEGMPLAFFANGFHFFFEFELGGHQWNIPALRSYLYDKVSQAQGPDEIEITHFFPGSGEKVLLFYATWVPRKLYQEGIAAA